MRSLNELTIDKDWDAFLSFRDRKLQGVQTGVASIDRVLHGLSGVVVIQGAPGCNKSTLALQVAQHQAEQGNPSLIIDRENGRERFRLRLLCMSNRVSTVDALTCTKDTLRKYVTKIQNYPLYVCTDPIESADEISKSLAALWEKHQKPMLLVVDSLQAMPLIAADERLSIQEWMKQLDQLKLDWEGRLTIIVTSEKARGEGGRNYSEAKLSSGKGAGGIEYKAEMVLDMRRANEGSEIIVEIVKNRDGCAGVAVRLQPVLANPSNPSSFTFKLEEAKGLPFNES
jgi:replicative DNA helicase